MARVTVISPAEKEKIEGVYVIQFEVDNKTAEFRTYPYGYYKLFYAPPDTWGVLPSVSVDGADVKVQGATSPSDCNGVYEYVDVFNGRRRFKHETEDYWFVKESSVSSAKYVICDNPDPSQGVIYFRGAIHVETPPDTVMENVNGEGSVTSEEYLGDTFIQIGDYIRDDGAVESSYEVDFDTTETARDNIYRLVVRAYHPDGECVTSTNTSFIAENYFKVIILPASLITDTSARLVGQLLRLGDYVSADCYFAYKKKSDSSWVTTTPENLTEPGEFYADITGLDKGETYEFKVLAEPKQE